MKPLFLLLLAALPVLYTNAQWSDKTNYFTDSNHMPVSTTTGDQQNALTIRSYPDSGYIVFWEDNRNSAATNQDIYAQKFDKAGKRLWAADGIPVSTGANRQHLYPGTNADSRSYSYAATDSANGFYITYIDDSTNQYAWPRIIVQHITPAGSRVFGTLGYIIAEAKGNSYSYDAPQLIADGNKGFYIAYKRLTGSNMDVQAYCYKDENGAMKYYGGGQMDYNVYLTQIGGCANYTLAFRDAYASDFAIYPDRQNGCNVVMSLKENGLGNNPAYIGFNRLIRVKKNTTTHRYGDNTTFTYKKDTVVTYYRPFYHTYQWTCGDGGTGTGYVLESNGFQKVGYSSYEVEKALGVTLATSGNINADIITSNSRLYTNTVSPWFTQRFVNRSEVFDDMPYEFKVTPYTPRTYGNTVKPGLNKINGGTDTLLSNGDTYLYNYSMNGGGGAVYATALCRNVANTHYDVLLQGLQLSKKTADSFAVEYATALKKGIIIGKDTAGIKYYNPRVSVDANGRGTFYIRDYYTDIRVSPIINGAQLAWGAMGRLIGGGLYGSSYYYADAPFLTVDAKNGTGVLTWQDYRNYSGSNGLNIMMRHLDKLTTANYYPPYKPVEPSLNSNLQTFPLALAGSSKKFSLLEMLNPYPGYPSPYGYASPVLEIQDNVNLGVVYADVHQNTGGTVRQYNGDAYLDRNINVRTETHVAAATKIVSRFFFTTADFNALKAADASVKTPADLIILRQPSTAATAPSAYTPAANEKNFAVIAWKAVNNGYYIQAGISGFVGNNNYFIFPAAAFSAIQVYQPVAANAMAAGNSFIKKLYPTPVTNGQLIITTGNAPVTAMTVEVYAGDGKLLYRQTLPYATQEIRMPLVASGVYRVKITSGKYIFEQAVVCTK